MELILCIVIGSFIGSSIVIKLCKTKPTQELIRLGEEQLKKQKKIGEELDKLLEID